MDRRSKRAHLETDETNHQSDANHMASGSSSSSNTAISDHELAIDQSLRCPVCLQYFEEACMTSCGHSFCTSCLTRSLKTGPKCPTCQAKVDENSHFPNHLLDKLVADSQRQTRAHTMLRNGLPDRADLLFTSGQLQSLAEQAISDPNQIGVPAMRRLIHALDKSCESMEKNESSRANELILVLFEEMISRRMAQKQLIDKELAVMIKDKEILVGLQQKSMLLNASSSPDEFSTTPPHHQQTVPTHMTATTASTSELQAPSNESREERESHLKQRETVMKYFDDLQKEYIYANASRINVPSAESDVVGVESNPIDDFTESVASVLRYSGFRSLATLNYKSTNSPSNALPIVSSIEFDKDGEFFAVAGVTKLIKIYDFARVVEVGDGAQYAISEMQCSSKISCLSYNQYSKCLLASSDYEGCIQLWDPLCSRSLRRLHEHEKRCWSVKFSPCDAQLFASGSDDATVRLWSTTVPSSVMKLNAKVNVCCVTFSPTKQHDLVFGSSDHRVQHYDLRNTARPVHVFEGHRKAVSYVRYLNENQIMSASTDSNLRLWDVHTGECLRQYAGHTNEKNFVGMSVDRGYIVCGSETNSLHVYHKSISRPLLQYNFYDDEKANESGVNGRAQPPVFDLRRARAPDATAGGDTVEFVSAVCWKKANEFEANSQHNTTDFNSG